MAVIYLADPTTSILYIIGYILMWLIIGGVLGFLIGKVVDIILNDTVEKWIEKKKIGKELKDAGLAVSDLLGAFTGIFIFILFLQIGVSGFAVQGQPYQSMLNFINFIQTLVFVLAFITAGLIFVDFLADYVYRLSKGYNDDVAEVLRLVTFVGFVWLVLFYSINMLGIQYTLMSGLAVGFVALSIGFVLSEFVSNKIKDKSFTDFAPYAKYYLFGIFLLVAVFSIFSYYVSNIGKLIEIFAWGFVALFIISALPFIIRAIKELY